MSDRCNNINLVEYKNTLFFSFLLIWYGPTAIFLFFVMATLIYGPIDVFPFAKLWISKIVEESTKLIATGFPPQTGITIRANSGDDIRPTLVGKLRNKWFSTL